MKKERFKTRVTLSIFFVKNKSDETELKIQVFWDMTFCLRVGAFQRCLRLQGQAVQTALP